MAEYDLVVRGGMVATGFGATRCDIGVKDGRIAALAERITDGARVVEAGGLLVIPGGVDSHCHIEEPARGGYASVGGDRPPPITVNEESFGTASTSAFATAEMTVFLAVLLRRFVPVVPSGWAPVPYCRLTLRPRDGMPLMLARR